MKILIPLISSMLLLTVPASAEQSNSNILKELLQEATAKNKAEREIELRERKLAHERLEKSGNDLIKKYQEDADKKSKYAKQMQKKHYQNIAPLIKESITERENELTLLKAGKDHLSEREKTAWLASQPKKRKTKDVDAQLLKKFLAEINAGNTGVQTRPISKRKNVAKTDSSLDREALLKRLNNQPVAKKSEQKKAKRKVVKDIYGNDQNTVRKDVYGNTIFN